MYFSVAKGLLTRVNAARYSTFATRDGALQPLRHLYDAKVVTRVPRSRLVTLSSPASAIPQYWKCQVTQTRLMSVSVKADADVLAPSDTFPRRHTGSGPKDMQAMLDTLGVATLDDLISETVPASIRMAGPLKLAPGVPEHQLLKELRAMASENKIFRSYIGMGYYNTITPPVILRNVIESPAWYTPYTPYQPEVSQGRLESLLNYQTMVCDMTGMQIANGSLLDEATAGAEAMTMSHNVSSSKSNKFFISKDAHPQTIAVVQSRALLQNVEVIVGDHDTFDFQATPVFGALVQYPTSDGRVIDLETFVKRAHAGEAIVSCATDLLALTLLKPPADFDVDIAFGSAQRFGVPLGYGGPHAAFFATRDEYKRQMPGRIIGVSRDVTGKRALRMAMQTREQHIRRDKATSNICTSQALLANTAAFYAVYHGPEGLKQIATRVHSLAKILATGINNLGVGKVDMQTPFFDTVKVELGSSEKAAAVIKATEAKGINLRPLGSAVGISFDETTTTSDVEDLWEAFAGKKAPFTAEEVGKSVDISIPSKFARTSQYLTHSTFNSCHTEHEMLRYIYRLQSKDISLAFSMIPLGSCTMKLNATAEMIPITWPEFNSVHPFAPVWQAQGYAKMINSLRLDLAEITGFYDVSLQPNSGAAGEYAGLLCIDAYHKSRGDKNRTVCLIPTSAHGTNPASAVMAGMKVVTIKCDNNGNIDVVDLKAKAEQYKNDLSALMITYPSTHGVFEETVKDICSLIHSYGGQVYMDGANMNAQVGLCRPGDIGADVCHLNLHKTFCIPHGGGGPGMGPIGVAKHLAPFLPSHPVIPCSGPEAVGAVSAAPWGSASILPISWMYIHLMGGAGLTEATKFAILNANYMAVRLSKHYKVLYTGSKGRVAHEFILDLRPFKASAGVEPVDVAKRLVDFGFHAPTMSWPVPGTIMVEPTESESKAELDRFVDALITIREEIALIERGLVPRDSNTLKNAPHTTDVVMAEKWTMPYSRAQAAYPAPWTVSSKFWPTVSRVDDVYGDRHLVCTCPPMESYEEAIAA
mmetsp:Transcript_9525/g.15607  ORF Transcript_9525/g.15607 Transcript_9525/m.15607 type:complete len:1041 (+) Transcript_9525:114-3236(+)